MNLSNTKVNQKGTEPHKSTSLDNWHECHMSPLLIRVLQPRRSCLADSLSYRVVQRTLNLVLRPFRQIKVKNCPVLYSLHVRNQRHTKHSHTIYGSGECAGSLVDDSLALQVC